MTREQIESLNLGIIPTDPRTEIIINSGIEWIGKNTTIDTEDVENFPNGAKLFLLKYFDLQMLNVGVSSESIEGLSQSYNTGDTNALLWQLAEEMLGPYLKGRVHFVQAISRWR